nr:MAG TPA: hypothetical protein [Caudoviricetes sp.]
MSGSGRSCNSTWLKPAVYFPLSISLSIRLFPPAHMLYYWLP